MRAFPATAGAIMLILSMAAVGCAKLNQVIAMREFKQANQAYQQQDYQKAAELYEYALQQDPNLNRIYFYLGNSYDNQFKPSRKGEPANDALLDKAAKNYQISAERLSGAADEADKKLAKLSLQYLVTVYGVDKLNDPGKAEPVVQQMIQLEPNEPTNYFALAKIYEDAGAYPEAEQVYLLAKTARPNDPSVYTTLAGYYNRQGEFTKTIEALEERAAKEPNNPEAHHTIASYYWDEATRDARLSDNQKRQYVQKGLEATDHALTVKADYIEALVFKGLLLRLQANLEKDPTKQQALIKEAITLRDKAEEIRKRRASGVSN